MTTIIQQPAANSLNAAYRPIIVKALISPVPPISFCDIYFNGVFYKTLSNTADGATPTFDLQDATQEYLSKYLAPNGTSIIRTGSTLFTVCEGRIRGSSLNANGFLIVDPVVPVQATAGVPAVAGTGLSTNSFFVVNATLQNEDLQDLASHLDLYKTGTWSVNAWPLTHRRQGYRIAGSDYFPIAYNDVPDLSCIRINYKLKDGTTGNSTNCNLYPTCPALTGLAVAVVDDGNAFSETFTFTWNPPDPILTGIIVAYRVTGTLGPFTVVNLPITSPQNLTLPLGFYDFRIATTGPCVISATTVFLNQGIAAPACVSPGFTGSAVPPNGLSGVPYNFVFNIHGSHPITLTSVIVPTWMTIAIIGSTVVLSGTPMDPDIGTSIQIQFVVHNACGDLFSNKFIDVLANPRTLTFSVDPINGVNTKIKAQLNGAVDVDIEVFNSTALGYSSTDCTGPYIATMQMQFKSIPAGQLVVSGADYQDAFWTSAQSYHMGTITIGVAGVFIQNVFPGQVVTFGSYAVTIIFNGC